MAYLLLQQKQIKASRKGIKAVATAIDTMLKIGSFFFLSLGGIIGGGGKIPCGGGGTGQNFNGKPQISKLLKEVSGNLQRTSVSGIEPWRLQVSKIGEIRKRSKDRIVCKAECGQKSNVAEECRGERTRELDPFKDKVSDVLIGTNNPKPSP
ncbi:conserved hypothetical protein [Ricinus communis]|uniref:Uncharacterized protein n=1 Tax=Ricinus communis TaxID=3988 RepID=B9RY78_RICCO|nr:conserved hypothetical protein [Ricinus communis]